LSKRPGAYAEQREDESWWDDLGRRICGAKISHPDRGIPHEASGTRRCSQRGINRRNKRCRKHGGTSRAGAPISNGRYSKALGRFREFYEGARVDERLADLNESLALLDVGVQKAAQGLANLDTPDFRKLALQHYERAANGRTREATQRSLQLLGELLRRGAAEFEAIEVLNYRTERMSRVQAEVGRQRLSAASAMNEKELVAVLSQFCSIAIELLPPELARTLVGRYEDAILSWGTRREETKLRALPG